MEHWDQLRLFLAVARSGTLSAAAERVGVSAATLHRHLAELEADLGSDLFEKGPRGYQLTPVGEALLPQAEEVEEAVLAAARTVVGHDRQTSGEVRLTLPTTLLSVLAPMLADFARQAPRIRLILQAADTALDLKRETDLALRATNQPTDTAIGRKLFEIPWARYGSRNAPSDELPWIHYCGMDHSPAVAWRKKTFPSDEPLMRVEGVMGMLGVLPTANAQGLLPCFVGEQAPGLRRIGPPVARHQLWLLIHADLRRSARVRAVIDYLLPRLEAERARFEDVPDT